MALIDIYSTVIFFFPCVVSIHPAMVHETIPITLGTRFFKIALCIYVEPCNFPRLRSSQFLEIVLDSRIVVLSADPIAASYFHSLP